MTDEDLNANLNNIHKSIDKYFLDVMTKYKVVNKLCTDAYVGTINVNSSSTTELYFALEERKKIYSDKDGRLLKQETISPKNKNIAIILESPHIKEYEDSDFIHPAIGVTGLKLQNYFENLFKKTINGDSEPYNVYILNAIQFPTSLLHPPINRQLRDEIFKHLWKDEEIKEYFVERLKKISPNIIINACTGDLKDKKSLRKHVEDTISNIYNINNIKYYTSYHPSSSGFSNQKKFEYVKLKPGK